MKGLSVITAAMVIGLGLSCGSPDVSAAEEIIHDAEYYILKSQNGEKWAQADVGVSEKLAALEKNTAHHQISFTFCGTISKWVPLPIP